MKNNILFSALLATLVFAGCAKEEPVVNQDRQDLGEPAVIEAGIEEIFTTKSQLEGLDVNWSENDKLKVFAGTDGSEFTFKSNTSGHKGLFEGVINQAAKYYALYPFTSAASISESGVIRTTLPSVQKATLGSFAEQSNLSVGVSDHLSFSMKNVGALVKITVSRNDVKSLALQGNAGEKLAGDIQITLGSNGLPTCQVVKGEPSVKLDGEGNLLAPGTYYFVVLPQVFSKGFTVTYSLSDGSCGIVKSDKQADLTRSLILNIGTPETAINPNAPIDLSRVHGTPETANCYIAGLAGREYMFPATVMGNGRETKADPNYKLKGACPGIHPHKLAPLSAKLLWQTEKSLIQQVKLQDGYVHFTLNGELNGQLKEGNAVIAVYDDEAANGNILWSWHIWVTDDDLDAQVKTFGVYKDFGESIQLMDRNLGALTEKEYKETKTNKDHGLFYQWGRKDPFIDVDDSKFGSNVSRTTYNADAQVIESYPHDPDPAYTNQVKWSYVSTKHLSEAEIASYPMVFYCSGTTSENQFWMDQIRHDLWGAANYPDSQHRVTEKTIYDPCPAGYRVMSRYAMTGVVSNKNGGDYAAGKFDYPSILNATTFTANQEALHVQAQDGSIVNFPACGMMFFERFMSSKYPMIDRVGTWGYMWSDKMSGANDNMRGYRFQFNEEMFTPMSNGFVSYGCPVRCEKIR